MKVVILTKEQAAKFPVIGIFDKVDPIEDINGNKCLTPEMFKIIIYGSEIFDLFAKDEVLTMQLVDFLPPIDDTLTNYEIQKSWYSKIIDKFIDIFKK